MLTLRSRSGCFVLLVLLATVACGGGGRRGAAPTARGCCIEEGARVSARYRVEAITTRRFTQSTLWSAIEPSLRSTSLRVTSFGQSVHGRPLRAVTFGSGPTTVLLWSQMHGDESTATMALADLLSWFAATGSEADPLRDTIGARLTVVMVPMLNPDGAELFQRENAIGVDVNRDARRLATPEARALKALRDSIKPSFGFNLHDQNARTIGRQTAQRVGIALLAPAAEEAGQYGPTRATARLVAARIRAVLERVIPGRIARYDDAFNARAFGDLFQQWGTSTVLIESGALPDDPEKQRLRDVNVVAILTALEAIATGGYRASDPAVYESLPVNDRSAVDVVIVGATLVVPGQASIRADIAMNYDDALRQGRARVREMGDLSDVVAFDTVRAEGLFVHVAPAMLTNQVDRQWLRIGAPVEFSIRKGADTTSEVVRTFGGR